MKDGLAVSWVGSIWILGVSKGRPHYRGDVSVEDRVSEKGNLAKSGGRMFPKKN